MWKVQSDPKLNLSKILWLSSLPASLMKIWSKMKLVSSRQHFSKSIRPSRAGNSHANSRNWAKIKLVRDFMPVLIICMFDEDLIKTEVGMVQTTFSPLYVWEINGQVTLMWMVPSAHKSNLFKILWLSSLPASLMKIQSTIKSLSPRQYFPKSTPPIKAGNTPANSQNWPWRYYCLKVWTKKAILYAHHESLRLRWAKKIDSWEQRTHL